MAVLSHIFESIYAFFRLLRLGGHFLYGFILLFSNRVRWGKQWFYTERGAKLVQRWMWQGSRILGLNIQVNGSPCSQSAVLVSNHISWLDIVAIAASTPVTFVSKADLEHWPIVGALAKLTGTIFIKRGSLFAVHKTLHSLANVMALGRKAVFFPEGTTTTGENVNKFHTGLFESACASNTPVQPVAISYFRHGQPDRDIAPYVDDDHFMMHLWNLLRQKKIDLQLDFLDVLQPEKYTRHSLAQACQRRISEVIELSAMINADYPIDTQEVGAVLVI